MFRPLGGQQIENGLLLIILLATYSIAKINILATWTCKQERGYVQHIVKSNKHTCICAEKIMKLPCY